MCKNTHNMVCCSLPHCPTPGHKVCRADCVLTDDFRDNLNSSNKRCTVVYKQNFNFKLNWAKANRLQRNYVVLRLMKSWCRWKVWEVGPKVQQPSHMVKVPGICWQSKSILWYHNRNSLPSALCPCNCPDNFRLTTFSSPSWLLITSEHFKFDKYTFTHFLLTHF